jgi:hypothetical protein
LLALVRVVTVLFAMHFSGLIHGISDLVEAVVLADSTEHEQCPPAGPCEDCPPGCPNCHCGVLGSLEPESPLALLARLPLAPELRQLEGAEAPVGPELPSLFRPPRV